LKVSGNIIVSCWNGIIYYISADGSKQVLLDTRNRKAIQQISSMIQRTGWCMYLHSSELCSCIRIEINTNFHFPDRGSVKIGLYFENLCIALQPGYLINKQDFFQRLLQII
jgi:hypothetical protein